MLSLPKTKDIIEAYSSYSEEVDIMLKMDGLTCSLLYENGVLVAAETRGDGEVGEDILHNAQVINNIPQTISYPNKLIVDGEIIVTNDNWRKHQKDGYKTQRAYASGSLRLLDSKECSKRDLSFVAWDIINPAENLAEGLMWLLGFGFTVVPFVNSRHYSNLLDNQTQKDIETSLLEQANNLGYPYDGLVIKIDNAKERQRYTSTAHHLGGAIAYKFIDEEYITQLIDIDYDIGRTGVLTPVAVFEPINIDGSTITRASLHNLSVMEKLLREPYYGQKIWVYKANQIIPQIIRSEHLDEGASKVIPLLEVCPLCGEPVTIESDTDSKFLFCSNPNCSGKFINILDHFCSKKGLDIKGLSKSTIEKLIEWNWVNSITDLFKLQEHRSEWIQKPGFGVKSVNKILDNLDMKEPVELHKFICAIGIPEIGTTASKLLCKYIESYEDFRNKVNSKWNFSSIDSIGPIMEDYILNFDYNEADNISKHLILINNNQDQASASVKGKKFVITGSLSHFKNRNEFSTLIESCGGKVVSSVSKITDYLVCNDKDSNTSKHITAKKYNIPIISEEECISLLGIK